MENLAGKKLLIIGGAFQHCKLVEAARELGVTTYVTDYLPPEQAPAKQLADHYSMLNITDIDGIVELCRQEQIDGVISTSLDACQRPYQLICERLGVPCFGTAEQFRILTDKSAFKDACRKSGVDVIPEYKTEDFDTAECCAQRVEFPILVKPCESRGSRGQSICTTYEEAVEAISFARSQSANGEALIEKYMGQANDFSMTILMLNGRAYPYRTLDRILGSREDQLDKLAVGSVTPSVFTEFYMKKIHHRVEKLYRDIGLVNAPVFMQGFVDGDTIRFYDPGLRLPGSEFERSFLSVFDKNVLHPLIEFALTGQVSADTITMSAQDVWLKGKTAAQMLVALRPGTVTTIEGFDVVAAHPNVVSAFARCGVGDVIRPTHNVNQRFCEINIVCDSDAELKRIMDWVYDKLRVLDENGRNMITSHIDTTRIPHRFDVSGNGAS